MVSHRKRHQRIYVNNQLMDDFYVLSKILIENCSFQLSCQSMQNQARSTNWHSAIDRSIAIDLLAIPGVEYNRNRNQGPTQTSDWSDTYSIHLSKSDCQCQPNNSIQIHLPHHEHTSQRKTGRLSWCGMDCDS